MFTSEWRSGWFSWLGLAVAGLRYNTVYYQKITGQNGRGTAELGITPLTCVFLFSHMLNFQAGRFESSWRPQPPSTTATAAASPSGRPFSTNTAATAASTAATATAAAINRGIQAQPAAVHAYTAAVPTSPQPSLPSAAVWTHVLPLPSHHSHSHSHPHSHPGAARRTMGASNRRRRRQPQRSGAAVSSA